MIPAANTSILMQHCMGMYMCAGKQLTAADEQLARAKAAGKQRDEVLLRLRQDIADLAAGLEESHADQAALEGRLHDAEDTLQAQQVCPQLCACEPLLGPSWPMVRQELAQTNKRVCMQAQSAAEAAKLSDELQALQESLATATAGLEQAQQELAAEQVCSLAYHSCRLLRH